MWCLLRRRSQEWGLNTALGARFYPLIFCFLQGASLSGIETHSVTTHTHTNTHTVTALACRTLTHPEGNGQRSRLRRETGEFGWLERWLTCHILNSSEWMMEVEERRRGRRRISQKKSRGRREAGAVSYLDLIMPSKVGGGDIWGRDVTEGEGWGYGGVEQCSWGSSEVPWSPGTLWHGLQSNRCCRPCQPWAGHRWDHSEAKEGHASSYPRVCVCVCVDLSLKEKAVCQLC